MAPRGHVGSSRCVRREISRPIFGKAWADYEKAKAKERQVRKPADSVVETFPQQKSRDAIGARVGVSGRTYEKFEQYRRGVQLLRDKGHLGTITKEQARKAAVEDAKANPLSKNGNGTGENNSRNKNRVGDSKAVIGNTNEYLLRRLARDAPEILDKIESGELAVGQATIQAGI